MEKKNHDMIIEFLRENNIGIDEVIDAVIEYNGIIGVGLITLEEEIGKVIKKHYGISHELQ